MTSTEHNVKNIQKEVLELYEKAWKLEKESIRLGIRKQKSEIFLAREILQILIEIQDDYNNDGSSLSPKLKRKKINLISKYIFKLKTSKHIEMLTDFRNRNVILLLISIPCKQTTKCMNHLIKKLNCDIHSIDNEGHNACHIACEFTNISALKLLYKYNVNMILKDNSLQQLTPLHIAIDILISSQKNANSQINTHKYCKIVKLCTQYALLQGQDIVNEKIKHGNGSTWNFELGQSIMDIAIKHICVLTVIIIFVKTDSELCIQYYAIPTPPTIKPLYTLILAPFAIPKRSATLAHIINKIITIYISSTYASTYVPVLTTISVRFATPNQPPVYTPKASSNTHILSPIGCGDLEYAFKNNYLEYNNNANLSKVLNLEHNKWIVNVGIQLKSEVVHHNIWLHYCHTFNMIYFLYENIIHYLFVILLKTK